MYVCSSSIGRALIAKNFKVVEVYVKSKWYLLKGFEVPFSPKHSFFLDLTFFVLIRSYEKK